MASTNAIAVASSVMMLIVSAACSAAEPQTKDDAVPQVDVMQAETGTPQETPPTTGNAQEVPEQPASGQSGAPQATTTEATPQEAVPDQPASGQPTAPQAPQPETAGTTPQQPPAPATADQATPVAPTEPAPGSDVIDPSTYVPKTEHDNTPWRFNMTQGGRSMTADEFDAWLKKRGVRVATGKAATPVVQNCPTPEGDKGDQDGDGIINCLDQCPTSEAGQTIGPDGCPVPVSIDLKGVTFAYDKASLSNDAKVVLGEAVEILQRHSSLKVEVAGHTDARGADKYNQLLSERRARAVYDYLVERGIDRSRLIGPTGFGESRPIVPNQKPDGSDDPDGRAKNRRVELNIQN